MDMSASVKLVLRKDKKRPDGTCLVFLRSTANRRSRYRSTKIWVAPKDWNERVQKVRNSHSLSDKYNQKLQQLLLTAKAISLDADTAEQVIASLGSPGGELTAFFEHFIANLEKQERYSDTKKYRVTLRKVRRFYGDALPWTVVNHRNLKDFERHLRDDWANSPNTIRKEIQRLHRVYIEAISEGLLRPEQDPFHGFKKMRSRPTKKRRLSFSDVARLESCPVPSDSGVGLAKDVFLFAFYAGGMRFSDVCRLRSAQVLGERVTYDMSKTGKSLDIPIPPPAVLIADRWRRSSDWFLFPMLAGVDPTDSRAIHNRISSRNVSINRSLKELAEKAGLDKPDEVSMHVARHSFADFARRRTKDVYTLSKMLGHSDVTVTQTYLESFDQEAVDDFADELWRSVT